MKSFSTADAAFKWARKSNFSREVTILVRGTPTTFFRDERGLIDSHPVSVKCLDCGSAVPYGQACHVCGLGE